MFGNDRYIGLLSGYQSQPVFLYKSNISNGITILFHVPTTGLIGTLELYDFNVRIFSSAIDFSNIVDMGKIKHLAESDDQEVVREVQV